MFQPNPNGLASVGDRIRGCISLAICIGSFTAANYSFHSQQWMAFFMITGFLNMLVTLGIMFKDMETPVNRDLDDEGEG